MTAGAEFGRLVPVADGPGGLRVWGVTEPPRCARGGEPVEVNVLLEAGEEPGQVDRTLLGEVVAEVDRFVGAALGFVQRVMASDPGSLGLSAEEAGHYLAAPAAELPLGAPQVDFFVDGWQLRFTEGSLPVCDPYGLAVVFDGRRPVRVEDLSDAEPVEE
ncbi:hypothetical protein [Kitasatospora sp. NPDC002965]|uniref:hypothetical protein n=1 Tax=Kitasatospora sp. NPDC002965 TaxID=3154775 RepID=UPI00339E8274